MKNPLKDKRGTVTIYVLLTMIVLVPTLLFASMELPSTLIQHRKLKNTIDNAASSAASRIIENQLHFGIIEIDANLAEHTAKRIIAQDYKLDPVTLEPLEDSIVSEAPTIQIQVINSPPKEGIKLTFPTQELLVENTSVVIYIEMKINGIFFKFYNPIIKHLGSTQAMF